MTNLIKIIINIALDLVYPDSLYCICCGKIIDESRPYRLCNECMDGVNWATGRLCAKCGKPMSEFDTGQICYGCREQNHLYRQGYTCARYGNCERAIVFSMKYGGRTDIAKTLGEIMADRLNLTYYGTSPGLSPAEEYDAITAVPMYEPKRLKRGFNQAELIARELSSITGIPYEPAVMRMRDTPAMKGLSRDERDRNVSGAFQAEGDVCGKTYLVVDDLYTTGATADAVTKALLDAGAEAVDYISFASGADRVSADAARALDEDEETLV